MSRFPQSLQIAMQRSEHKPQFSDRKRYCAQQINCEIENAKSELWTQIDAEHTPGKRFVVQK